MEDPIVVNPGQTVTLVCVTVGGEPTPTLTWVSNAETLPQKAVLNGGTLTLPAVVWEDAGIYSCVANNNVGNPAKKSATVIVRGSVAWCLVDKDMHYVSRFNQNSGIILKDNLQHKIHLKS